MLSPRARSAVASIREILEEANTKEDSCMVSGTKTKRSRGNGIDVQSGRISVHSGQPQSSNTLRMLCCIASKAICRVLNEAESKLLSENSVTSRHQSRMPPPEGRVSSDQNGRGHALVSLESLSWIPGISPLLLDYLERKEGLGQEAQDSTMIDADHLN